MKRFFKFGCLGVIGLVVLIVIIALASGGDEPASTDNTNGGSSNASQGNTSGESPEKLPGIGETVEVGDMAYTINGVTTADQVGPSTLPEEANGKYIVLDVTVKNNGNEAVTVDGTYFKLLKGEKTFEADSAASMSANQGEDGTIQNSFFMQQLNPSSEMTGKVVFDVAPEIAESNELVVQVQEGIFGSVSKKIDISK